MATYYVSPDGNNANNGISTSTPWETSAYALTQIVRGDTLLFNRDNIYPKLLPSSIAASGTTKITFGDYGTGAKPIFSGALTVPSWVSEGGNLWSYTNASFVKVEQLKIGGVQKERGTFPSTGYYFPTSYSGNTSLTDTVNLAGQDFTGGELFSRKEPWIIDRQAITGHAGSTLTVTGVGSNFNGNGYKIQNHPDCCTSDGDWAFYPSEDKVYLYSLTDPNTLDVEVSFDQRALEISSSPHLNFVNLTFEMAYEDNIFRNFSADISFNGCESRLSGRDGMKSFVSPRCTWEFGLMEDIANNGIYERDTGGSGVSDSIFRHSKFENIGIIAGYGQSGSGQMCGIFINNSEQNVQVYNNYFNKIGNIGVNNRSPSCDIYSNYCLQASFTVRDAAAFYAFGANSTGSIYEKNIAINCHANNTGLLTSNDDACGYYSDDNSNAVIFRKNYTEDVDYGLYLHNVEDSFFDDNYIINAIAGIRCRDDESQGPFPDTIRIRNNSVQRNIVSVNTGQKAVSMTTISAYEFSDPWLYGTFADNKYDVVDSLSYFTDIPFTAGSQIDRDLSGYQTYTGLDATSTEEAFDRNSVQNVLNDSFVTDTIPLTGIWKDWDNNFYYGEIELGPMESKTLFFVSDVDPKLGTELFFEDWESGDVANWNINGEVNTTSIPGTGGSSISTEQAYSGIYSLKMTSDNDLGQTNNFRYSEPDNNVDFIATFHLYFPAKIDLANNFDSFFNLIQTKGVNLSGDMRNDPIWVMGLGIRGGKGTGGNNYLTLAYLGQFWPELGVPQEEQTPLATIDIPIGEWFKVQMRYLKSEDNGIVQVWQDDTLLFEKRQGITFPSSLVSNLFLSVNNYGEERLPALGESSIYLDNVTMSLLNAGYDFGDLTLTLNSGGNGTVSQSPEGIHGEGDEIELSATPDSGYSFVGWFDGVTLLSTDSTYIYTMPSTNKVITGQFQIDVPIISTFEIKKAKWKVV